ncbi:MAG: AMP-binding protein [Candidatus Helarchaeota archaeon]
MSYGKILSDNAVKYSDLEIVKCGKKVYTYSILNNRSNQVAHAILELGIKKNEKFGILLYNSPKYLEIMFGLQKIGVVPVPINTRYGFFEFKYIFNNADIIGLFLDKDFVDKIENFIEKEEFESIKYFFVVEASPNEDFKKMINYEKFIENKDTSEPDIEIDENETGLLLYTGGTTGYPKGAILTHRNLKNATFLAPKHAMKLIMANKLRTDALIPKKGFKMKFLIPTPIYHVSGLMPVLTQIGLRNLIIFPESKSFNPKEICEIIETEKVTTIFMVPTMYHLWLDYKDLDKYDFSSLTMIASGGAKLPLQTKIRILERFPHAVLVDGYGSTETIGTSTIAFMNYEDIPKIKKGYIGQIVTGVKMRVINDKGEDVPVGEIGEMIYKGTTIMQGYYKDNDMNKTAFDENGWLHSGDLCKIDEEGNVYYVGRKNEMIISGGEKIYPLEIEELLREHPKIEECVIIGVPDRIWGHKVVAFIELIPDAIMTQKEIIGYLEDKIASYKKPRIIIIIDEIPITITGKIDRRKIYKMAVDLTTNNSKQS